MRKKRTHCVRGHPFEGDNLAFSSKGSQVCKECSRRHALRYYHKKQGREIPWDYQPYMPLRHRFEEAFIPEPNSGCWLWIRGISPKGYGQISLNGQSMHAHRAAWTIYRGAIPDGLHVLHHCDNPGCVNPDHLFLGTNADNVADKIAKGRENPRRGEANGMAKLTSDDVRHIRVSWLSSGELAVYYDVSISTIQRVRNGSFWESVT